MTYCLHTHLVRWTSLTSKAFGSRGGQSSAGEASPYSPARTPHPMASLARYDIKHEAQTPAGSKQCQLWGGINAAGAKQCRTDLGGGGAEALVPGRAVVGLRSELEVGRRPGHAPPTVVHQPAPAGAAAARRLGELSRGQPLPARSREGAFPPVGGAGDRRLGREPVLSRRQLRARLASLSACKSATHTPATRPIAAIYSCDNSIYNQEQYQVDGGGTSGRRGLCGASASAPGSRARPSDFGPAAPAPHAAAAAARRPRRSRREPAGARRPWRLDTFALLSSPFLLLFSLGAAVEQREWGTPMGAGAAGAAARGGGRPRRSRCRRARTRTSAAYPPSTRRPARRPTTPYGYAAPPTPGRPPSARCGGGPDGAARGSGGARRARCLTGGAPTARHPGPPAAAPAPPGAAGSSHPAAATYSGPTMGPGLARACATVS
jgi:hypothetical protein